MNLFLATPTTSNNLTANVCVNAGAMDFSIDTDIYKSSSFQTGTYNDQFLLENRIKNNFEYFSQCASTVPSKFSIDSVNNIMEQNYQKSNNMSSFSSLAATSEYWHNLDYFRYQVFKLN